MKIDLKTSQNLLKTRHFEDRGDERQIFKIIFRNSGFQSERLG
jgi:hypothetical protein